MSRAVLLAIACAMAASPAAAQPVTFSKDIAPILFEKCASCHHPDGVAPFSLISYRDARAHLQQIVTATQSGVMPPWKADPVPGGFVGQSPLTPQELDLIKRWSVEGGVEGDRRALPRVPAFTEGWQLGTPDLVVSPPAYALAEGGTDIFRIFVVRVPVATMKYVRAMEFLPGNPRVVHHANIRLDRTAASRRFDDADAEPGYEGLIAHSAAYPDGHFLGWTPGQVSPFLPKGLAWELHPDTDLVIEVHMQPSGKREIVQPTIGFYFGSDPPTRRPAMLRLGRQGIDIPPGDSHYTISDSYTLPVAVEVQAIQPHAHQRAKNVVGVATLPDGSERVLLRIQNWDFRWQHVFRYQAPVSLPAGTRLSMTYTYDNSADNPRNPVLPPRRVYWGQRSADEMGDLWIQVLTHDEADLETLTTEFQRKVMAEDVIGYERWIQSEPTSAALHDDVGSLYLQLNRPEDAVRHFAISSSMQPSAQAFFNLGTALAMAGQPAAAVRQYERALEARPGYVPAHTNLGSVLLQQGNVVRALEHLNEAVRLDPANPQAQFSAGIANQSLGRHADAVAHLTRAVQSQPDFPEALANLGWLYAVAPEDQVRQPSRAVPLAERAVTLTKRRDPASLDALAAAYAATGAYDRAVSAANEALALNPANAADITARRELYRNNRSFRLPLSNTAR